MKTREGLSLFWRFILFGYLISLGSLIGQTFFFGLFNTSIRQTFGLSHGDFGFYYLIGTLVSALVVAQVGRLIDHVRLQVWTLCVLAGLLVASIIFATAQNLIVMTLGIFLLRVFGQGLMSHTSSASMSRYFSLFRGRALALAGFGEATYMSFAPLIVAPLILIYPWQNVWLGITFALIACLMLAIPLLLGRARSFGEIALGLKDKTGASPILKGLTRSEMVKTIRFRYLVPVILAPSFVNTGVVFHYQHLALEKSWGDISLIFPIFAITAISFNFILGYLVDWLTASRLSWFPMVPMTAGMALLSLPLGPWSAYLAFFFFGITSAAVSTIITACWAEMFGPKHIGAIRALAMSMMVIGSALAPFLMGALFDLSWSAEQVCMTVGLVSLVAMISGFLLSRHQARINWD